MIQPKNDGAVLLINGRSILLDDEQARLLKEQLEQYLSSKSTPHHLAEVS